MTKRLLSVLLSVTILLLLLVACSSNLEEEIDGDDSKSDDGTAGIGLRPEFSLSPRERPTELFPELDEILYRIVYYDNGLYVYAKNTNEPEKGKQIYFADIESKNITSPFSLPENFRVDDFAALSDGSLIVYGYPVRYGEYGAMEWVDDNYQIYHLTKHSSKLIIQGENRESLSISNAIAINEKVNQFYTLFSFPEPKMYAYSLTGDFLFEIALDYPVLEIIFSEPNNTLLLIGSDKSDNIFSVVDIDSKRLLEILRFPHENRSLNVYPSKTYGLLVVNNNSTVYGYDFETNALTEFFELSKQGISGYTTFIHEYNDFFIVYEFKFSTMKAAILKFNLFDDYDGPVEELRLAKFEAGRNSLLEEFVAEFNFLNPQYFIEIDDYYRHGDDAATQLHLDIIKNEAPDILLLSEPFMPMNHMPIQSYIAGGILVDLAPYMARDLNFDDYWKSAMQQLYTENSCYIAVPSFSVYSIIGKSSVIDEMNFSNTNEFFEILKDDFSSDTPKFALNMTQEQFAIDMMLANMDQFADYENGLANFNSNEFVALLEAAYALEPEDSWDLISLARRERHIAFLPFESLSALDSYVSVLYGDFSTVGFPDKNKGTALIPQYIFGIPSATQNTEAAWAFLRMVYEYENLHTLSGAYIPMNIESYSRLAKWYEALEKPGLELNPPGSPGHSLSDAEGYVNVPNITTEQFNKMLDQAVLLIEQIDRLYLVDSNILNIVLEELPVFFNGDRSANNTAEVIQSRTQIYLWELK